MAIFEMLGWGVVPQYFKAREFNIRYFNGFWQLHVVGSQSSNGFEPWVHFPNLQGGKVIRSARRLKRRLKRWGPVVVWKSINLNGFDSHNCTFMSKRQDITLLPKVEQQWIHIVGLGTRKTQGDRFIHHNCGAALIIFK
jgi:hypothetical protein